MLRFGIPKTFPFQHSFDNRAGLQELAKNHGRAWIIHGDKDTVIPLAMSRTLAKEFKGIVTLRVRDCSRLSIDSSISRLPRGLSASQKALRVI